MGKSTGRRGEFHAIRTLQSTVLATALTGFVYFVDQTRQGVTTYELNQTFAREIASQVEGVALAFRERGDLDALGSAIRSMQYLVTSNASPHARLIRIDRVPLPPGETYQLNATERIAEYARPVFLELKTGVRVRLRTEYPGMFGAKSRATNDATLFLAFSCLFILCYRVMALAGGRPKELQIRPAPDLSQVRSAMKNFAITAKEVAGGAARVRHEARQAVESGSEDALNQASEDLAKTIPSLIAVLREGQAAVDAVDEKERTAA
ncbi:MAG: hypothetical protein AAB425_07790 [Bdellovibrionota bacterium]